MYKVLELTTSTRERERGRERGRKGERELRTFAKVKRLEIEGCVSLVMK
jgi:hypothetical protein